MPWTTADQVRQRVRQATADDGWGDAEIGERITRAEDRLKSVLVGRYGKTEVVKWDTPGTTPTVVDDLAADLAAVFVFLDAYGQNPNDPGTAGGALNEHVKDTLRQILERDIELVLSDGTVVQPVDTGLTRIDSTTRQREPLYSIGEKVQDTAEKGTLDAY